MDTGRTSLALTGGATFNLPAGAEVTAAALLRCAPQPSPRVARAIEGHSATKFGPPPNDPGGDWVPVDTIETWELPAIIQPQTIEHAKVLLKHWDIFMAPAPIGEIGFEGSRCDWLSQLATLCVHSDKVTIEAAAHKLAIMAPGMEYPQICFTPATLYAAARKYKFFSFIEVDAYLEKLAEPLRRMHQRIRALAEAQPRLAPPPDPPIVRYADASPEERAKHDQMMKDLKARLLSDGVGANMTGQEIAARARERERVERQREQLRPAIEAARARFMGDEPSP